MKGKILAMFMMALMLLSVVPAYADYSLLDSGTGLGYSYDSALDQHSLSSLLNITNGSLAASYWSIGSDGTFDGLMDWTNLTAKPANLDIDSTDDMLTATANGRFVNGSDERIPAWDAAINATALSPYQTFINAKAQFVNSTYLAVSDGTMQLNKGGVQHFSVESLGWGGGYLRMTDTYSGLIAANNTVRLRYDPDGTGNYAYDALNVENSQIQLSINPDYLNTWTTMDILQGSQYGTNLANNTLRISQNGGGGYTKGLQLFNTGAGITNFSTDDTLAGDSDSTIPTEAAVKGYVDGKVTNSAAWDAAINATALSPYQTFINAKAQFVNSTYLAVSDGSLDMSGMTSTSIIKGKDEIIFSNGSDTQLMKISSTLLDLSGIDDGGDTLIKSNGYIAFENGSGVVQFGTGEGLWNVVDDDANGDRSAAFGEWWLNSVGKISWNQNNSAFTLGTTANSTSTDTNSWLKITDGSLILNKNGVQHFSIESLGWGGGYLRMTDSSSGLIAANNTVRLRIDPDGTGNYAFDTISSESGDVQLSILPDYINNPYVGMYVLTGNQYGTNLANNTIRMSQNGGGGYTKGLQLFGAGAAIDEFSTDDALAGDSDTALPTEAAVKGYVDGKVTNSAAWDAAINATALSPYQTFIDAKALFFNASDISAYSTFIADKAQFQNLSDMSVYQTYISAKSDFANQSQITGFLSQATATSLFMNLSDERIPAWDAAINATALSPYQTYVNAKAQFVNSTNGVPYLEEGIYNASGIVSNISTQNVWVNISGLTSDETPNRITIVGGRITIIESGMYLTALSSTQTGSTSHIKYGIFINGVQHEGMDYTIKGGNAADYNSGSVTDLISFVGGDNIDVQMVNLDNGNNVNMTSVHFVLYKIA